MSKEEDFSVYSAIRANPTFEKRIKLCARFFLSSFVNFNLDFYVHSQPEVKFSYLSRVSLTISKQFIKNNKKKSQPLAYLDAACG